MLRMQSKVAITRDQAHVLPRLGKAKMAEWTSKLDECKIIQAREPYIFLSGIEPEVQWIEQELKKFINNIHSSNGVVISVPGALGYSESGEGRQRIQGVQDECLAYIEADKSKSPTYFQVSSHKSKFNHDGGVTVFVYQDRMSKIPIDVVICPSNPCLEMGGDVGEDLLQAGSREISVECAAYVQRRNTVPHGQIYHSKVGNLQNCSHIFHAVGPKDDDPNRDAVMQKLLEECIKTADNLQVKKIALPLDFNYPVDKLTKSLWNVLDKFLASNQGSTQLKEIHIVDMNGLRLHQCVRKLQEMRLSTTVSSLSIQGASAGNSKKFVYYESSKTLMTEEGLVISLFTGDITDVRPPVEVLVNSTDSNLNLSAGTLSGSIHKAAGAGIQDEVLKRSPGGLKNPGGLVNTEAHNIPDTRCVYHCHLVRYDGQPDGKSVKLLHKTVLDILAKAHEEGRSSIAIPAIGSGILGIPKDIVADCLFDAVNMFSQKQPGAKVKRVVLVAYDKDAPAVTAFTKKYEEHVKNAKKGWTVNVAPHDYQLHFNIHTLSAASLQQAEAMLRDVMSNIVTREELKSSAEPKLSWINDDKAKALQTLQFTHHVRMSLTKVDNKLESLVIEGFTDDVTKAKQDVLTILAM